MDGGYKWTDLGAAGGCGLDPACWFFVGGGNLFLNGDPWGAVQLGGAELAGLGGGFAGGEAAPLVGQGIGAALDFSGTAVQIGRSLVAGVIYNPELMEGLQQFGEGLLDPAQAGANVSTWLGWIGFGMGMAYETYEQVGEAFGH